MITRLALTAACLAALATAPAHAAISLSGSVSPSLGNMSPSLGVIVGHQADGTLTIDDGSTLTNLLADIAYAESLNGTVHLTGPASAWTLTSGVNLGRYGHGTLNVTDGATLNTTNLNLATQSSGQGTLYVADAATSLLLTRLQMAHATDASASGRILGGTVNASTYVGVATRVRSQATLEIAGSGTTVQTDNFDIAAGSQALNATGTVDVHTGATLNAAGRLDIAQADGATGTLTIRNASVTAGFMALGATDSTATLRMTQGATLQLQYDLQTGTGNGGTTIAGHIMLDGPGTAITAGFASIRRHGSVAGGQILTLDDGASVDLAGKLTLENATLQFGIGPAGPGHLAIGDIVYGLASSTLDIRFLDGVTPALGDSFDLFDWTTFLTTDPFAQTTLPNLAPYALAWDTSALYTTGTIAIVPEPATLALLSLAAATLLRRRASRG